jgi:hypothetical protein
VFFLGGGIINVAVGFVVVVVVVTFIFFPFFSLFSFSAFRGSVQSLPVHTDISLKSFKPFHLDSGDIFTQKPTL